MKIGLISDTHGFLDPKVFDLFKGVDHILHGGDIGDPLLVLELQEIAPVTAVLGNNDPGLPFRETEIIDLAQRKFLIHHIVNPRHLTELVATRIARARPQVVVFGHTHARFHEQIGEIFFCNPGYAGKPRFGMERSVAILSAYAQGLTVEFFPL